MFNRIRTIRKRWLVVFAAVALLTVGLVSGAVFAANSVAPAGFIAGEFHHDDDFGHGDGRHGSESSSTLFTRVAEILGVEKTTLDSAFQTARAEQVDAGFTSRTGLLVADGTLTQEQADEANTWFADRPDEAGKLAEFMAGSSNSDRVTAILTRLVMSGQLTQEQAESVAEWNSERPDFLPEFGAKRAGRFDGSRDGDSRSGHHR